MIGGVPVPRRRRRASRGARFIEALHHGPNMTPMVDVVMVILIFFMASASLLGPELLLRSGLADAPPDDGDGGASTFASPVPALALRISISRGGEVVVEGLGLSEAPLSDLPAAAESVAAQLGRSAALDTSIVIGAEDAVPYESVIRAFESVRAAGFERVAVR